MKPPLPHGESAMPRTLHAQLEIAKAIRTLLAPDDDEPLRRRRTEIAAIRGELEAIKLEFQKAGEECLALGKTELRAALAKKYNPDQPRVSAGNRDGGQWTSGSKAGSETPSVSASSPPAGVTDASVDGVASISERSTRYAALETGTVTDETGGVSPNHRQGVRYAGTAVEIDASALTGIDNIDETTKRLAKILASSVDEVGHVPGAARFGTAVHVAFEFNVFFAGIRGIGPGDIEQSFSLPPGYPSTKKTVIPDVVLRNDIGDIIAIYDVKTGGEGLSVARRAEFRAATGVDRTVPIIELRVCNDPTDCTYATTWWD
jgi:hypothetical protein